MNNREIKFRAWDIEQKRMSLPFVLSDFCLKWQDGDIDMPIEFGVSKNRIVIQQYTGLKDKNGKEIYEGDIISGEFYDTEYHHSETIKAEVVFNNGAFNIAHSEWHKPSLRIVGNVMENPELIKNNE